LIFGFVSAQSQAAAGMLLRQSLAKKPKILSPHGYTISSKALAETLQRRCRTAAEKLHRMMETKINAKTQRTQRRTAHPASLDELRRTRRAVPTKKISHKRTQRTQNRKF
jgi:hypothetical protein